MEGNPQWPTKWPYGRLLAFGAALFTLWLALNSWMQRALPLQSTYIMSYLRVSCYDPGALFKYRVVLTSDGYMATLEDHGEFIVAAEKVWDVPRYKEFLRDQVYGGQTIWQVLQTPFIMATLVLVAGFAFGSVYDNRRNSGARHGRLIRGPQVISKWKFNMPFWLGRKKKGMYIDSK